jgi:hypothetical protein
MFNFRRFERELEALRKEIAESAASRGGTPGTSTPGNLSKSPSQTDLSAFAAAAAANGPQPATSNGNHANSSSSEFSSGDTTPESKKNV